MNNTTKAAADGEKSAPKPSAAPLLMVEIITNGILIGDAHHAAGKVMPLAKDRADILAAMNPPAVKIIGVA